MSLHSMFDGIVRTYDSLNRILTGGLDEVWRKNCAKECVSGRVIVDLCCGTGELALLISKHVTSDTCVLGLDFSKAMLGRAMNKNHVASQKRTSHRQDKLQTAHSINLILADAAHLPFKDDGIDRIGIAFSFRNLVYRNPKTKMFLKETMRSLRPGGKFVCTETSQPKGRLLRIFYHLYLKIVVSYVGGFISRHRDAYRYLGTSAINFPPAEEITNMLSSTGFQDVVFKHMSLGAVAIHMGVKAIPINNPSSDSL